MPVKPIRIGCIFVGKKGYSPQNSDAPVKYVSLHLQHKPDYCASMGNGMTTF